MVIEEKTVKRTKSKGIITNYSFKNTWSTLTPNFSLEAVVDLVDKDPVARGAINHFVSKCMEGDYAIIDRKNKHYKRDEELRLEEKYNFRTKVLRKIFLACKFFNNVFIEIVRNSDGDTKSLNILDTTNVHVITKPNGDLEKLRSKNPNPLNGEYPEWSADDVVWVKFNDRTVGWAPIDFRALWENLLMKQYVRKYVAWLWKTGQYRLLYNPKDASDQDIEDFLAFLENNDENPTQPFILKGDLETKLLRDMKESESIDVLLKYLDNQTLILLRVPPVDAGIPDASGRSSADAQTNNLITSVSDMHKVVEDYVNYELFPKIKKGTLLLKFGPVDRFAEKQVFEVVQIMKSVNMTDEVCKNYMEDRGLFFSSDTIFNQPEEDDKTNPRDKDMAPSRIGKGAGEGNKAQEKVTTRPDQIKKE